MHLTRGRICKSRKNTGWREKEAITADKSGKPAQVFQPTFSKFRLLSGGLCGGVAKSGKSPFNKGKPLYTVFYWNKEETSSSQIERRKQGSLITFGPEAPLRIGGKPGTLSSANCRCSQNAALNRNRSHGLPSLPTAELIPGWASHCLVGPRVEGLPSPGLKTHASDLETRVETS